MTRITQFSNDNLTFDVIDTGPLDGEILVLLHGFPQRNSSWGPVTRLLNQAGYRTLSPDQRGYSPRARPAKIVDYRLSLLVGDVLALIARVGQPVHLVGHDWGANVAWATAAAHPDRLLSLTACSVGHPSALVGAIKHPRVSGPDSQRRRSWYLLAFQLPWLPERVLASPQGASALAGSGMSPAMVERFGREVVRSGALRPALNWYRALLRRDGPRGYSAPVKIPTAYLWSNSDTALGRQAAEDTAHYVTGDYQFREVGGSHWLPEEQPEVVASVIVRRVSNL